MWRQRAQARSSSPGIASRRAGSGSSSTTLLALARVGLFVFFWLDVAARHSASSRRSTTVASTSSTRSTRRSPATSCASSRTSARFRVTVLAVLLTAGWAIRTRRATREGIALVAAYARHLRGRPHRQGRDRPRRGPPDPHASARGLAYPSGHSAYAVALVACAVVLARGGHRMADALRVVGIAIGLAAASPRRASTCACTTSPTCSAGSRSAPRSSRSPASWRSSSARFVTMGGDEQRHADRRHRRSRRRHLRDRLGRCSCSCPPGRRTRASGSALAATLLSLYILAAFALAGSGLGAAILWYYDEI